VMIDTFQPLSLGAAAGECSEPEYYLGWSRPTPTPGR
jgi:hypothetical protein